MRRITFLMCGLLFMSAAGCQRGPLNTVKGEEGQELTVSVPESVVIAQGNKNKFSVTVARKKISAPATIKIEGLPKGVKVVDSKFDFGEGTNNEFVTIEASKDAEPQKDTAAVVTASAGKFTAAAKLKVSVVESLENKAAHKKAFSAEMEARMTKVKELLENAETRVKTSKDDDKRAAFLKQISARYEALADARGYYEKMLATPVEVWEREKDEVSSAVANVEKTSQALLADLKTFKD